MRLLVGLGNPGPSYARNRHNVGFLAADAVARRYDFPPYLAKFHGLYADGSAGGRRLAIFKPKTFMNESGRAVAEALRFFKLGTDALAVIHDEIDLAPGKVRVKRGGGNAGHNGLRSIDEHIGPDYWRVRIGVGRPADSRAVVRYVLQNFGPDDEAWLAASLPAIAEALPLLVAGDAARFTNEVARLVAPPKPRPKPAGAPDAPDSDDDGI